MAATIEPPLVLIGGYPFRVVTDITTGGGARFSYAEARVFAETGQRVYCSRPLPEPQQHEEADPEPFWKGLPEYKKRKYRKKQY